MACMTPAAEGTRISIDDPDAAEFRRAVIEGLMLSHPHDCPVCDEGGECHLQDMTVMTGHDYRRYRFGKRTWRNQNLGPLVNHEMNRCIQCYRCVRFYREHAGGRDLHAFGIRNNVYFGRESDGVLENEFSGNLVEVCPTGVFTDKTLRWHYTRKWDQQYAPSICVHCGLGCNISPGERYGTLRRIINRYNHDVNGYFLCDRGRFGYEFVNGPARIRTAQAHGQAMTGQAAFDKFRQLLSGDGDAIGIGSPRASLEANFALRKMVGPDRFHVGMADVEYRLVSLMLEAMRAGPRTPSLREIEHSDAVLILGEDVLNVAPRMALALRQSVRQQPLRQAEKLHIPLWMDAGVREAVGQARGPLFIATPAGTKLDDIATRTLRAAPDDIARLGFAVASALNAAAPRVAGLHKDTAFLAGFIAEALRTAQRPLVVAGPSLGSEAIIRAASAVARALGEKAALAFTTPEPNTLGIAMMNGRPLGEALASGARTVIVLENDLYRRAPAAEVDAFLSRARNLIALDSLANATIAKAGLALPAGTFAESDGTFVSNEGRAQRFFQVFVPERDIQESWRWLAQPEWANLDDVIAALATELPVFARVPEAAPPASFRMAGEKIPRQPHRWSGRTAIHANVSVHEPTPPRDPDSPLNYSMEGYPQQPPAPLVPFFWAPGWSSNQQSLNKFQEEVGGPLRGGPAGVRLVEPDGGSAPEGSIPAPFERRDGEFLVVPLHHIFGSEELSAAAPAIASLAPKPYLALNPDDAAGFGPEAEVLGFRFPVKVLPELPRGVAGVPAGIGGIALPAWGRVV